MSLLLKIVKGVNAGAEIALVEGPVTFGSGDACDIVLMDATLPAEAFTLETLGNSVSCRVLPDGEAKALEPYVVFTVGGMEFAVGEEGTIWPELRYPAPPPPPPETPETPEPEESVTSEGGEKSAEPESKMSVSGESAAEPEAETPPSVEESKKPEDGAHGRSPFGCLAWMLVALLLIVFFIVGYWLALRYGVDHCDVMGQRVDFRALALSEAAVETNVSASAAAEAVPAPAGVTAPSAEEGNSTGLAELAKAHGLTLSEKDGRPCLVGNLTRRQERVEVIAEACRRASEAVLDVSDDETLRAGVDELLFALTEGQIKATVATNRCVKLQGKSGTRQLLLETVAAICADVNHVRMIDDTDVVCEDGLRTAAPTTYRSVSDESKAGNPFVAPPAKKGLPPPKNPVAGIIVTPYPCIVMRDGTRAAEGAVVGGWTVQKITEDEVLLKQGEQELKWRP